jgi:hypothetical protein
MYGLFSPYAGKKEPIKWKECTIQHVYNVCTIINVDFLPRWLAAPQEHYLAGQLIQQLGYPFNTLVSCGVIFCLPYNKWCKITGHCFAWHWKRPEEKHDKTNDYSRNLMRQRQFISISPKVIVCITKSNMTPPILSLLASGQLWPLSLSPEPDQDPSH